jgi:hypothetical protein
VNAVQAKEIESLRAAVTQSECMLVIVEWVVRTIPTVWAASAMDLDALELPERSRGSVKPIEENKDGGPRLDDDDQHANLVGLCHDDIQDSFHVITGHWLIWYQPCLVVILDT